MIKNVTITKAAAVPVGEKKEEKPAEKKPAKKEKARKTFDTPPLAL